jgi:nucleotide-binding universal stress UspA family protein
MAKQKKSRSRIGKLSRTKGKVFEREVAADLRAIYGAQVKRGWQAREGTDAPDVENVPYWVECKHHQRVNVRAAVKQARDDVKKSKRELPILVVVKDNGQSPLAVVDWSLFVSMLKQLEDAKNFLALKTEVTKVEVPIFKMAQPRDHRDRPESHDDGTV